ncbi:MAG: hypothetical protein WDN06_13175 [Asticcacaulis sp.]
MITTRRSTIATPALTGRAEIFEGERLTHTLRASPECHWLHIFAPVGGDFFCAEPVNHMPDPFNQPNSGLKCIKTNETAMVWMGHDVGAGVPKGEYRLAKSHGLADSCVSPAGARPEMPPE